MGLLIDTSVLVAAERGSEALSRLDSDHAEIGLSTITVHEYWMGVERADGSLRRRDRVAFLERVRASFEIVDVTSAIAMTAARVGADRDRRGLSMASLDLLIAATALERGWSLATLDAEDFDGVHGLSLVAVPA